MLPNVLFILADDLGYGDFGCLNGGVSSTPVLDQLMGEGVCFSQHYSGSPVCNPSRAALLTGRYPHRTGSIDTLEWRGLERLSLEETTLADVLRGAGYRTGLIGKWHLGSFDPRYHPVERGFDEALCFRGGMHDYYDWRLESGRGVVRGDGRYLTDVWTEAAIDFIGRDPSRPFFLHLNYNAPHTPLQAPEEDVAPFREREGVNAEVATLYGMIKRMDTGIGALLETLEGRGLLENTLVIFTSDNGPQFGFAGDPERLSRANCQLNGAKGSVYEGGIRVPLLMRWPGGLAERREIREMVHFCDWFPTLLGLLGIRHEPEFPLDGVDQSGLLRGDSGGYPEDRYWQWNRYTPEVSCNAAVRSGDWKLVRPAIREAMQVFCGDPWLRISMYEPERILEEGLVADPIPEREIPPAPPPELYHIGDDPREETNLAGDHPERVRSLQDKLDSWFESVEAERRGLPDRPHAF